jgi:hypothetical protein
VSLTTGRYGSDMTYGAASPDDEPALPALRAALAQGDAVLRSIRPILRHMLVAEDHAIFADEIIARVRGGMFDVARQILDAVAETSTGERGNHDTAALDALVAALAETPGFLGHAHALAVEWQLTTHLQAHLALDPTLPPLLQALLASDHATTSGLAMNLLAAQARFAQTQRRMALPLTELPADLLHGVLAALRALGRPQRAAASVEDRIRADYDESRTRLGLAARLVTEMGSGAPAALALADAGAAIFATGTSIASGQDRDVVILAMSEGQAVRLALTLRAAGLERTAIEEQLLALRPDETLPSSWAEVGADRAIRLLASAAPLASF